MARFQKARRPVAEFCREEGVSAPSFYQWRKRLARQPHPVELTGGFMPVRLVSSAGIAVQLPGGMQLHVPMSDPEALRVVIDTLARADAQRAGGGPC
jgi:hypothetical protein